MSKLVSESPRIDKNMADIGPVDRAILALDDHMALFVPIFYIIYIYKNILTLCHLFIYFIYLFIFEALNLTLCIFTLPLRNLGC
jgi:hypothetical protein